MQIDLCDDSLLRFAFYIVLWFFRCPIEAAVSLLGFTPSNVPFELNGKWLGRVEMKGFFLVDGEPLLIDYRAKLCRSKCYEVSII